MNKPKLRSKRGAYELEAEGENGERLTIYVSYLPNSGVLVCRVNGQHGDGEIDLQDDLPKHPRYQR